MDYYENQTYYDVLGVTEDASLYNIERAKDRLKFGSSDDRAPFQMWDKIDEAYSVLSDPKKRSEYDKYLEDQRKLEPETRSYEEFEEDNALKNEENNELDINKEEDIHEESEIDLNSFAEEADAEIDVPNEAFGGASEIDSKVDEEPNEEEFEEAVEEPEMEFSEEEPEVQEEISEENVEETTKEDHQESVDLSYSVPFKENKVPISNKKIIIPAAVASFALGGPLVGIPVTVLLNKKLKQRYKVYKFNNPGHIKSINTEESSLIEKYNKKLENEINKLLSQPHNSYKLEILKTRYSNEIELLRQRINLRKSMKSKSKLESINHKFKLNALENQLKTAERKLEDINNKIDNYERENKLSKINKDLMKNNKELETMKNEGFTPSSIRKVQLYSDKLLEKRNLTASRFKVKKYNSLSSKVLVARDFMKAAKNTFFENKPEVEEESVQKTR